MNNNVSNGHIGIYLYYSNGNSLTNNNATNHSGESIYLYSSNYNTLTENNVSNNYAGIMLEYSSNDNVLTNNNVSNDYYGIMLWESSNNNKIYLNNFINNTDSISSYESTNFWNSTEEITYTYNGNTYTNHLGNYWDDYTDVDTDNDGIWDHPYSIYHEEKDYYPLVEHFENYIEPKTPAFESKGIYVWGFSTEILKNESEKERFFNLSKNDGIKTVFLSIGESLLADPACKEFVKDAKSESLPAIPAQSSVLHS